MMRGLQVREIITRFENNCQNVYDVMVLDAARSLIDDAPTAIFEGIDTRAQTVAFAIAGIYVIIRVKGGAR